MHNTDYTDENVYPELRERLRGYPGVEAVTPAEFRHWASLVRPHSHSSPYILLYSSIITKPGSQGHGPASMPGAAMPAEP